MRPHHLAACVAIVGLFSCVALAAESASPASINVVQLGAKGDGQTLNTPVLQKAIDDCSKAGGGTLHFPPGTYLTGTLVLRDNVTLYLDTAAILLGSTRVEDYSPRHVITAKDAHNIGVAGFGTIDGQGPAFWVKREGASLSKRRMFAWVPTFAYDHAPKSPSVLIRLENCTGVRLRDVTLRNSPSWTVHLQYCRDVTVRGVKIRNPLIGPNTDGIDINGSSDVLISDCDIYTADDAICLKNETEKYWDRPCRNITVTNCILTSACNAFKIGTGTRGNFENIVFSNSVIKAGLPTDELAKEAVATIHPEHSGNALAPLSGIALETVDGGHVRGVAVSNIVMQGVRAPIFIRLGNRGGQTKKVKDPKPGTLQDVSISNIVAYDASTASSISGLPGHRVKNVTLSDIQITTAGGGTTELAAKVLPELPATYPEATMWGPMPTFGLFCRHVEGLKMRNIRIVCEKPDATPMLIAEDVEKLRISDLDTDASSAGETQIRLTNIRDGIIRNTTPPTGTRTWVRVAGTGTQNVMLMPDRLDTAKTPMAAEDDVAKDAVRMQAR